MKFLTADQILEAPDLVLEDLLVPEWGEDFGVKIKTLTSAERDAFENSMFTGEGVNRKQDTSNFRARLCALTIAGENGQPLFTLAKMERLGMKSALALNRCFTVSQRLNGFTAVEADAAIKNSAAALGGDSLSASV